MSKECRVLITTRCNLSCSYCCNKQKSVQDSIKMTTWDQLLEMDYDVFKITGGEPLIQMEKLEDLLWNLDRRDKKVYLYTNALMFPVLEDVSVFRLVEGVNIGLHFESDVENVDWTYTWRAAITHAHDIYRANPNVRLMLHDKEYEKHKVEIDAAISGTTIKVKTWKMNECEVEEDRYII